jgi:aminopeptidase N
MSALDSADQQYRLPRTVRPVRYDLSFSVDPGASHFTGSERVELVISERVAEIVCNCAELEFTSASLRPDREPEGPPAADAGAVSAACEVRLDSGRKRVMFAPPAPVGPGRSSPRIRSADCIS